MSKTAKPTTKKAAKKVQANKSSKTQTKKPAPKQTSSKYKSHPANPYKRGSYKIGFDILASRKDGMRRDELVKALAKETKKPERLCNFDVSVITSPTQDGEMHKSAKGQTYFVRKTADHVQVVFR